RRTRRCTPGSSSTSSAPCPGLCAGLGPVYHIRGVLSRGVAPLTKELSGVVQGQFDGDQHSDAAHDAGPGPGGFGDGDDVQAVPDQNHEQYQSHLPGDPAHEPTLSRRPRMAATGSTGISWCPVAASII